MKPILAIILSIALTRCAMAEEQKDSGKETPPLRLGMIGLDTSHVIAFIELLNDPRNPHYVPGAKVVVGYPGGSPDVEASATRVESYTAELRDKWHVEIVPDIPTLCEKVDAVLITSVDGRPHLEQVRPVFAAKKFVFIDKPMAGNLEDVKEIFRLSKESGVPCFSSSCYRWMEGLEREDLGPVTGCDSYSPATIEPHHPDLFWYGIHGVEALFTVMGPGCVSVTRVHSEGTDVVVGLWKDGRIGTFRGIRQGNAASGVTVFCENGIYTTKPGHDCIYEGLVREMVKFFQTGIPPVTPEETIQIYSFMDAADKSKEQAGKPVPIESPPSAESAKRTSKANAHSPYVVQGLDDDPLPELPAKDHSTSALIEYLTGPAPDRLEWAQTRAMAIDILAERKAKEAVPHLIECLADHRGLIGSDNWVGGHAANALSAITGRPFSLDQEEWKRWWNSQEAGS